MLDRLESNRNSFFAIIACISGFLFYFYAYTPGLFTPDTVDQYDQALTGIFEDGHPPIMAWLWSLFMHVRRGPATLLIFHLTMFWVSVFIIHQQISKKESRNSYLIIAAGLCPWIASLIGMLWKDIGMAIAWLLAFSLLIAINNKPKYKKTAIAIFIAALLYGIFVRVNAIFGAPPLIILACHVLLPKAGWKKITAITIGLSLIAVSSNVVFDRYIAKAKHTEVTQTHMMLDDLRALSVRAGENLTPSSTGVTDRLLVLCPTTAAVDFCYSRNGWTAGVDKNPRYYHELKTAWISAIKQDPLGWISFRLFTFGQLMRWSDAPYGITAASTLIPERFGFTYVQSRLSLGIEHATLATAIFSPPLFKPYFWLALSIAVFLASLKITGSTVIFIRALSASGAMYLLGYLLITPHFPFRYAYWTAMATTFSIAIAYCDKSISFNSRNKETSAPSAASQAINP